MPDFGSNDMTWSLLAVAVLLACGSTARGRMPLHALNTSCRRNRSSGDRYFEASCSSHFISYLNIAVAVAAAMTLAQSVKT
jgi:hypothetical protein